MAGLADGSASLSMSGREELMALKQTGRLDSLSVCLSHTSPTSYSLFAGTKLNFTRTPVLERYKSIVSLCRLLAALLGRGRIMYEDTFDLSGQFCAKRWIVQCLHPLHAFYIFLFCPSVYAICHWLEFNLRDLTVYAACENLSAVSAGIEWAVKKGRVIGRERFWWNQR